MDKKHLHQIRTRAEQIPGSAFAKTQRDISQAFFDRHALLEEIDRLLAENAGLAHDLATEISQRIVLTVENANMREIVQAVAKADPVSDEARARSGLPGWVASVAIHTRYVAMARLILATAKEIRATLDVQPAPGTAELRHALSAQKRLGPPGMPGTPPDAPSGPPDGRAGQDSAGGALPAEEGV